ncbi:hypothetical protein [Neisseria zalophi]|uniref:Uncharacterized protein n=1 Tax=Neisseria zalophi TaxID=640030 RepID=A0A5J6PWL4_9NEIS|nr:hypothetical protein [Neisseria zalophi]QEY26666.1 hypothetical protein D0T92_09090 [Neisseria zalophi]
MKVPIIINDNGDISFFANVSDAESYLEPDDIDSYEAFDASGRLLKLNRKKIKKFFFYFPYIQETVEISLHFPIVNKKDYISKLLMNFCINSGLNVDKNNNNLDELIALLINKIRLTK